MLDLREGYLLPFSLVPSIWVVGCGWTVLVVTGNPLLQLGLPGLFPYRGRQLTKFCDVGLLIQSNTLPLVGHRHSIAVNVELLFLGRGCGWNLNERVEKR